VKAKIKNKETLTMNDHFINEHIKEKAKAKLDARNAAAKTLQPKYATEASPTQFANMAYKFEKNKQMQGAATNIKEFENSYNEKKKQLQYPEINIPHVKTQLNKSTPQPEPKISVRETIRILADRRLAQEQKRWDRENGRGGIAEMLRPK